MSENQTGGAGAAGSGAAAVTTAPEGQGRIPTALLKLVQRPVTNREGKVVEERKGEPKLRSIKADEVLSWKEYSDRVVVVTTDGQKFVGAKESR
ncbi:MAG TPA: hypothetical protein VF615_25600 [Longimicrobiaceae bacterium]